MKKLKVYKIISGILSVLAIFGICAALYSIYLLTGIETFYRIMISLLLLLALITSIYSLLDSTKYFKKKKFIISSVFTGLLTIIGFMISIVIFTVYLKINDFNSDEELYKTSLISLENHDKNFKGLKIGMINNKEDIANYILPNEVIEKKTLKDNNEIVEYEDTVSLMHALLNKEVDLIFISSNYESMFSTIEGLETKPEIFEILSYEKKYKKTETKTEEPDAKIKLTDPFTILLLGVDSDASSFNADTIMMVTFDPETLHATMFSIPRDTYVRVCSGALTKITHSGWSGTNCVVKTVENFTGIKIDYYVRINFKGVVDLVDTIGGITVDVPKAFCESNSDRWTGKDWEICLEKGVQRLNGEQALALARHRKTLPLGDFQRGQNQQLVVEGMLNEIKNIRSVTDFYNILNTISKNLDTSMSTDQILSFYNIGKSILMKDEDVNINITKTFLTGYDLSVYEGSNYTYTFQYYKQSLDAIVKAMKINLRQLPQEEIKTFSFSIKEPYEKTIIGYKRYTETRKTLIPNFASYSKEGAESWGRSHGINIVFNEIESSDSSYSNGQITYQSVHEGVLLEKSPKTITLNIIKKVGGGGNTTTPIEPENPGRPENPGEGEDTPDPIGPINPTPDPDPNPDPKPDESEENDNNRDDE